MIPVKLASYKCMTWEDAQKEGYDYYRLPKIKGKRKRKRVYYKIDGSTTYYVPSYSEPT